MTIKQSEGNSTEICMKKLCHGIVYFFSIFALIAVLSPAMSQTYPDKPIRLVVPLAPGGATDILARSIAAELTQKFGQPVIVDNRAGAGGNIGHQLVVRSPNDGYTMLITSSSYATNAALMKLNYEPMVDISPITMLSDSPFMIAVNPNVNAKSTLELIALAKSKPKTLNYASSGTGSITHLAAELFSLQAGIKMTHVPFKGTGAALSPLISGEVQVLVAGIATLISLHQTNRVKGIAVTGAKRSAMVPDMPTASEAIPGFEATLWFACFGPKSLPKNIVELWNSRLNDALKSKAFEELLTKIGHVPVGGSPQNLLITLKQDIAKWRKVVVEANVQRND